MYQSLNLYKKNSKFTCSKSLDYLIKMIKYKTLIIHITKYVYLLDFSNMQFSISYVKIIMSHDKKRVYSKYHLRKSNEIFTLQVKRLKELQKLLCN